MDVPIKLVDVNPAAGARLRHSFDFGYVEVLHLQISVDAHSILLGERRAQLLPAQLSQSHRRVPARLALTSYNKQVTLNFSSRAQCVKCAKRNTSP